MSAQAVIRGLDDDDDCVFMCVRVCVGCFIAVVRVSSLLTEVGGLDFVMRTTACNLL